MFADFKLDDSEVDGARLRLRYGGTGPPVLLLHEHPRTHTTWYLVAPKRASGRGGREAACPFVPCRPGLDKRSRVAPAEIEHEGLVIRR